MAVINIIERAYQLASEHHPIEQIRKILRSEGYHDVDAHLAGRQIRNEIAKKRQP